ncbi:MAG: type IX secretion system sortase PorU [Prolixibacteraceae bacterium]|nr:type IX secretion system sortase PorU [Prolixibacteraceae bacterium]
MHRLYIAFTSLVFILLTGFAGDKPSSDIFRLQWNPRFSISLGGEEIKCLHFTGAVYTGGKPFIPVFTYQTEIGESENQVFEIENPVFSIYTGEIFPEEKAILKPTLEPVSIRKKSGKTVFAELQLVPLICRDGQVLVLESFKLKKTDCPQLKKSAATVGSWKTSSVLSSGRWVKIKTTERGIYKITYDKLREWGFTTPANVNIYGAGGLMLNESLDVEPIDDLPRNNIWHGENCILFYATGNIRWTWNVASERFEQKQNVYASEAFYYLTQDAGNGALVEKVSPISATPTHTIAAFDDYALHERELQNLIHSGQQWFGEKFNTGENKQINMQCPGIVPGATVSATINAAGRSSSTSMLDVKINNTNAGSLAFSRVYLDDATVSYASERNGTFTAQPDGGGIAFSLTYSASNATSIAWLDYITLNWRRQLTLAGDILYFRDVGSVGENHAGSFEISGATSSARVFDVTEPTSVFEIPATVQNNKLTFVRPAESLREYMVFNPSANFPEPERLGDIENQNLHAMEVPEFLIISHPDFLDASNSIADFHRQNDNMTVAVVSIAQVYNEFGSGLPDATAIRSLCKMLYDKGDRLKYVMLVGDGCFDNRNIIGSNRNLVPTFQSVQSLIPADSSFGSDDYFVILDPGESVYSGTIDLGIGRLPVSSVYEANIVARKIWNYHSSKSLGEWRNSICFLADDGDGGRHVIDSEELASIVNASHSEYHPTKIYFDAYKAENTSSGKKYPDVTNAINNRIKEGTLIFNYVGHASNKLLADEKVVDISTINGWTNFDKLPIFVTATCEFSRFDDLETSAGEQILLSPYGGGIALFSTTRVVYAALNQMLSRNFYNYVFSKDENGGNLRMGDVMRLAKINTSTTVNKRNFMLLGDPALRLAYPRHQVVTKTINGIAASVTEDSFAALTKVTITGEIVNDAGGRVSDFNGTITPVVYNRQETLKTLGNGGQSQVEYVTQNNIIHKGSASVINGEFTFSFVVPKDVPYTVAEGKIIYYAENGLTDANGVLQNFKIGGSSENPIVDNTGPRVDLYIDDTSFKTGGKTNANPLLLAHIFDESGINTVGTGIGHDITAILDNDHSNIFVLNDYYTSSKDDYTRGELRFPFSNLTEGEHTVTLKVWDVANNSTEAEIKFVVTGDFFIESVSNYPNPVYDHTYFVINHNQGGSSLSVLIEIFDMNGQKVDSVQETVSSSSGRTTPVHWNLNNRRLVVRSGIYVYRAVIRSDSGKLASKTGKMIIGR